MSFVLKKIFITIFSLILILFTSPLFAQEFYSGEYQISDFKNVESPLKWQKNLGSYLYQEKELKQHFNNLTQADLFELNSWWDKEFVVLNFCPNINFTKNINYTRYLFRILTLSYITEFLKDAYRQTSQSACSYNYDHVFKNCHPVSNDMKTYLYRLKSSYKNFIKIDSTIYSKKFKSLFCQNKNKCVLKYKCREIKHIANNICNENDNLYGQSRNKILFNIIKKSSAFGAIDSISMMNFCLKRFVTHFKRRESNNNNLKNVYDYVYYKLKKSKARYLEGLNFVPGSLKEFDLKGLTGFLLTLPKPIKIAKRFIRKKIKVLKKIKVIKFRKKRIVKRIIKKKKVLPKVVVKLSEFEHARYLLKKYKLYKSKIDLVKFKEEFKLSKKQIIKFNKKLTKFSSRKVLNEMKKFERLGSKDAPLPLIFIDYLLLTGNHQSLWNIVSILGNNFYVFNNLENIPGAVFIRLENGLKTGHKWNLLVIKDK